MSNVSTIYSSEQKDVNMWRLNFQNFQKAEFIGIAIKYFDLDWYCNLTKEFIKKVDL